MRFWLQPYILLSHVFEGGLLFGLHQTGTSKRTLLCVAILQELLGVLLWSIIPNSLSTILFLFICIVVYDRLSRPRLVLQKNLILIADVTLKDYLHDAAAHINIYDSNRQDRKIYNTEFDFVVYSPSGLSARKSLSTVDLDTVSRIDHGVKHIVENFLTKQAISKGVCLTLIFGDGTHVAVVTKSESSCGVWVAALQQFCARNYEVLKQRWIDSLYDSEHSEGVSLERSVEILAKIGFQFSKIYLKDFFNTFAKITQGTADANEQPVLTKDTFNQFVNFVVKFPELLHIFERHLDKSKNESVYSFPRFCSFLKEEQKLEENSDVIRRWIAAKEPIFLNTSSISLIGFSAFLLDDNQSLFNYKFKRVYQDMDQPLAHYFIATSHNTYLTKDQLKGKSSVEAYVSVLKRGCKCVELDCWDGSSGEPVIYHGHTLTSKILFKDVIVAIEKYAFVASDYPVILSFENHCSVEQQKVMAEHLVAILGDKLLTVPLNGDETALPSPEKLKGKVIVKAKKLKGTLEDFEEDDDSDNDDDVEDDEKKAKKKKLKEKEDLETKTPTIAQELSDLVVICQAVKFKGFSHSKANQKFYEMSSFGEKKALKLTKDDVSNMQEYTCTKLSRIYPAGSRVDSSNYDPMPLWRAGCQMVALNYQTSCNKMQVNQGFFSDNGGCGYVLKPPFMRNNGSQSDDKASTQSATLVLKIIMGMQLPYSNENKLKERNIGVQVRILSSEKESLKEKTKFVKNNGYNPIWNEEFSFSISDPDLAVAQFLVESEGRIGDNFLGQYAVPIRCMAEGEGY